VRPDHETSMDNFSCLGGIGADKKRIRTRYAELVCLLPTGSAGHVVHPRAFGAQNMDALFFMLE
jgi:hypothetical protein